MQWAPNTTISESGDATLVAEVGRSSEVALAELYQRHAGAVLALARRVLGDRDRAEEVVQEVFLRLWTAPGKFDPARGSLRSYLLAQSHGRAIDILRSESARRQREERDARAEPAPAYDLESEVVELAIAERVREAMDALTPDERRAVELAYFGGRTYREVAAALGEPEGTIKSRIRSGLGRMRTELAEVGVAAA